VFEYGDYRLHSGGDSCFRIDCTALTYYDLCALASMIVPSLKPFGQVYGIPRGGVRFADVLQSYSTIGPRLVVDDVLTTGASMQAEWMQGDQGLVIFARTNLVPEWIRPIFSMHTTA
jgi:hypothetical protein